MSKMNDPKEILKLIKILSPQTLPRLEYISREDLTLTNVHDKGINKEAVITQEMRYSAAVRVSVGCRERPRRDRDAWPC